MFSAKLLHACAPYGCFPNKTYFLNCSQFFFKQMTVAHSIFTLDGWVQLFWAAFDMPITVVPLKVALGLEKIDFWSFQKNNRKKLTWLHLCDYFF